MVEVHVLEDHHSSMAAHDDVRRAAEDLTAAGRSLFSPLDLIEQARGNGSSYEDSTLRTHIVHYSCINATGRTAGMYPDLFREYRGMYRLVDSTIPRLHVLRDERDLERSIRVVPRTIRAQRNSTALIDDFDECLSAFENEGVFGGPSLYFHVRAIGRQRKASSAASLLSDERFIEYVYAVLPSWGMHRMGRRGAKVPSFDIFSQSLRSCIPKLDQLWNLEITSLTEGEIKEVGEELWDILASIRASTTESLLVSGSKTLHHLLPNLMPPIDRQYTFWFFTGQTQVARGTEHAAFTIWWPYLCEIGQRCRSEIWNAVGRDDVMATSVSKVIDNAIIGFRRRLLYA